MPRPTRADEAGAVYHALNRATLRSTIFHKDENCRAFEAILGEALELYQVELYSFVTDQELVAARRRAQRGQSWGSLGWIESTARCCNPASMLRPRGRTRQTAGNASKHDKEA